MDDVITLRALAARVETEEPSEELRAAVLAAIGSEAEPDTAPNPLRSVDDALSITGDRRMSFAEQDGAGRWHAVLGRYSGFGASLSAAVTAAALRAIARAREVGR